MIQRIRDLLSENMLRFWRHSSLDLILPRELFNWIKSLVLHKFGKLWWPRRQNRESTKATTRIVPYNRSSSKAKINRSGSPRLPSKGEGQPELPQPFGPPNRLLPVNYRTCECLDCSRDVWIYNVSVSCRF